MTVSIELQMEQMGQRAKKAARVLSAAAPAAKTKALRALAALLIERQPDILKANALDVDAAKAANMDAPRLDRLTLTPRIMADMADACLHIAEMADEVGVIEQQWQRPNGLMIGKMRIPLGVIAMIFESRPNVTIDAAILCLKAGDAVILRGGSEAIHSNLALAGLLHEALRSAGLPEDAAQVVETTDRAAVAALCKLDKYVDVMIPRGGESLVRAVCEAATMPVLKHYMGVCHLYIDEGADLDMALRLAHNGKVQRPGVCNALECLLVHEKEAAAFLPMLAGKLGADGVEFRELLLRLNRERQTTILISSHILSELSALATHYAFIDRGRMLETISAADLRERCRDCLELRVDDAARAAQVLEEQLGTRDFEVLPQERLRLYAFLDQPQTVNRVLMEQGVGLISAQQKDSNLEDYFLSLIDGHSAGKEGV